MTLADLLVSYKQVESPRVPTVETVEPQTDYSRLLERIDALQKSKEEHPQKQTAAPVQETQWIKPEEKPKSEVVPTYGNYVENNPWSIKGNTKITKVRRSLNTNNYKQFQKELDTYLSNNKSDEEFRDLLTNIAAMESSFKQDAKNPISTALGYFQFLDGTRKSFTNATREEFEKNPQLQIATAVKYLRQLKDGVQRNVGSDVIEKSGLTPLQIMYGMWWRPKSMYNYLLTGKDDFSTKDGMNIKKILEKAS